MQFKINFNRALVISFSWHLLCFFMFTIIIVPVGVIQKRLSDIYFLGSLLDKKSLKHESEGLDAFSKIDRQGRRELSLDGYQAVAENNVDLIRGRGPALEDSARFSGIDSIIGTVKIYPDIMKKERVYTEPDVGSSEITGKAKDRLILFKPPLPDCKIALSSYHKDGAPISCNVRLRLVITKNGTVKIADTIETSGYPDIDLIAIRYVKKWKFIPLKPDQLQEDQEGIVRVELGS